MHLIMRGIARTTLELIEVEIYLLIDLGTKREEQKHPKGFKNP